VATDTLTEVNKTRIAFSTPLRHFRSMVKTTTKNSASSSESEQSFQKLCSQALKTMTAWETTMHTRVISLKNELKINKKELHNNRANVEKMLKLLTEELLEKKESVAHNIVQKKSPSCTFHFEGLGYSPFEL
jgi:uncharacterized protein YbbK (DUF523 family)